jgi:hypothetical protein
MESESLADNAGWQAWNMSKRVSEGNYYAQEARALLDTVKSSPGGTLDIVTRLRELLAEIEVAANRGVATWERIKAAMAEADPSLVAAERGVDVIRNHGSNPALTKELRRIWSGNNGTHEACELFRQFEQVAEVSSHNAGVE